MCELCNTFGESYNLAGGVSVRLCNAHCREFDVYIRSTEDFPLYLEALMNVRVLESVTIEPGDGYYTLENIKKIFLAEEAAKDSIRAIVLQWLNDKLKEK